MAQPTLNWSTLLLVAVPVLVLLGGVIALIVALSSRRPSDEESGSGPWLVLVLILGLMLVLAVGGAALLLGTHSAGAEATMGPAVSGTDEPLANERSAPDAGMTAPPVM